MKAKKKNRESAIEKLFEAVISTSTLVLCIRVYFTEISFVSVVSREAKKKKNYKFPLKKFVDNIYFYAQFMSILID